MGTTPTIAIPVATFMRPGAVIVGPTPQARCNDSGHGTPMIAIPEADDCGSLQVAGDPRAAVASNLLAAGGTISVHVLNEIANVARRRKFKLPWAEVDFALAALRVLCAAPVPLTLATNTAALALAERHQFLFYDALIVASALEAGCTTLLSEDLHHGRP